MRHIWLPYELLCLVLTRFLASQTGFLDSLTHFLCILRHFLVILDDFLGHF